MKTTFALSLLAVASGAVAQSFPLTGFLPPCAQGCVRIAIEGENHAGTGSGGAVSCDINDVSCLCEEDNRTAITVASVICVTSSCGPEIGSTAAMFALNQLCSLSGF